MNDWGEIKTDRYILVNKGTKSIDFTAPTYDDLYTRLAHAIKTCSPGCAYLYKDRYEVVDLFEEPGRVVYSLQDPPRLPKWEAGTYFADDDNTSLRFKAMELT